MLREKIIEYSKKIGIDLIGFTDLHINNKLKDKLLLQKKLGYITSFQKGTIDKRINPKLLMNNCNTIIAIALSYSKTCSQLESLTSDYVYFSSSSWGIDYHKVLRNKMELLVKYIKEQVPNFEYKIIVDTSPLCDRTIAYEAGLGFFGKNNLLINEKYGSYIFLGSILTNLSIENSIPKNDICLNCNKCIKACPTGALNNYGILNPNKCLAYLTQKKQLIKKEEKLLTTNCIYGCDICSKVCPYNKKNNINNEDFKPLGIEFININKYVPLSNKEFYKKYGLLSGSWRGASIINRNIKIYKQKINN